MLNLSGSLDWRARRSGVDPPARGGDELVVRQGQQRSRSAVYAAAGLEGPENQRLLRVMLQQARAVEIMVLRSIRDRPADLCARQDLVVAVLPLHRQRRQVPARGAGNPGGVGVGLLVTAHALECRDALAFRTAHYVGEMPMTIVPLLRVIRRRMAVDTTQLRQDRVDLVPRGKAFH